MFVKQSTYDAIERRLSVAMIERNMMIKKYNDLLREWNETVEAINSRKGAWAYIETGNLPNQAPVFTQEDIRSLIQLVHPDKHAGKESAVRLTQVLIKMRK